MKERFDSQGRLIIPLSDFKPEQVHEQRFAITEAYCPNGHSLIDEEHVIDGFPGIRLKFKREGMEGEFVISAIEGDINKEILSGTLEDGKKDALFCPHCGVQLKTLSRCSCSEDAEMVVIGLTPKLDFNNAIAFCDITGCENGTFIKSSEVIKRDRLKAL